MPMSACIVEFAAWWTAKRLRHFRFKVDWKKSITYETKIRKIIILADSPQPYYSARSASTSGL